VEALVAYQVGAMLGAAALVGHPVTHVKAHGALANAATVDDALADAIARAVRAPRAPTALTVEPSLRDARPASRARLSRRRARARHSIVVNRSPPGYA
jgi:UPF0271 protein